MRTPRTLLVFALTTVAASIDLRAAQLDVMDIPGATLKDNPLGDPPARHLAVFKPDNVKDDAPLPLVIYLPGWGSSAEDAIADGNNAWFGKVVDLLAKTNPLRIAVVDGRSRYGGSQFLNSTATGRYADYVSEEILPALTARYSSPASGASPVIAGHSSGGYGALLLGMKQHDKFNAVVALSPDSAFDTTHRTLVNEPNVRAVTPAMLTAAMAPGKGAQLPKDGLARLVMGLCANYAPVADKPGQFEWLYDDKGQWRADVWKRWLDLDPLMLVRRNDDAFAPSQRIYLDGAEQDEFGANIGARKIFNELKNRASAVRFYQPPGHHGDNLPDRLARGLVFVLGHE
ncbi:MAG: alpha/beta hydrolase [Chthoniobacter sp.]|uniref:alpha/beta hydrolase n=1 Tax=Chthoniobacter sp. TaxID=2510640 RepID=UPI0032A2D8D7